MKLMHIVRASSWLARLTVFFGVLVCAGAPAHAVNVVIDYTYDTLNTHGFFGAGNPGGAAAGTQARAALEAAASFYSNILTDTFAAVQIPPNYSSEVFNGVAFWGTQLQFTHPTTAGTVTLSNQTRAANEYRIYTGARDLAPPTLGIGGYMTAGWSQDYAGNGFTQDELDEITAINAQFDNAVQTRGEPTGFAAWGGVLTFDSVDVNWHFNHTTLPTAGKYDFFSVAIHELGHALGLGTSDEWDSFILGSNFTGPNATSEFGANPPLHDPGHWAQNTMSQVYGTGAPQEAAMDPNLTVGTLKRLTQLDAAAMVDIGWEIDLTPPQNFNAADFNEDSLVNGADLTLWRSAFRLTAGGDADGDNDSDGSDFLIWQRQIGATNLTTVASAVPEPHGAALLALAALWVTSCRRRVGPISKLPGVAAIGEGEAPAEP